LLTQLKEGSVSTHAPPPADPVKLRVTHFAAMKREARRIAVATAYDAITAAWCERAGIDLILVGDSLGNTALGYETTIPVRLEAMLHHAAAVARAARRAFLVGDMPFMTCRVSTEQTLVNCARMIQEGGMEAVKLEGGSEVAPMVERLVTAGIPVMGHIGLLPQSVHQRGGYRVQGRDQQTARQLRDSARDLELAGAFSIVLEGIPAPLAAEITRSIQIPTIGIGAGPDCDGQVLVLSDLLGMIDGPRPKFVKSYATLHDQAAAALAAYADDVRAGRFPTAEHSYGAEP